MCRFLRNVGACLHNYAAPCLCMRSGRWIKNLRLTFYFISDIEVKRNIYLFFLFFIILIGQFFNRIIYILGHSSSKKSYTLRSSLFRYFFVFVFNSDITWQPWIGHAIPLILKQCFLNLNTNLRCSGVKWVKQSDDLSCCITRKFLKFAHHLILLSH